MWISKKIEILLSGGHPKPQNRWKIEFVIKVKNTALELCLNITNNDFGKDSGAD